MPTSRVQISKKLVLFNSVSALASRLLNLSVLFWMYQYLLARVSPEDFAIYPVVAAIIAFAPLMSSVLTGGIARYIVDAYACENEDRAKRIHSSSVLSLAVLCFVGIVLATIFSLHVEHFITVPASQFVVARLMMFLLLMNFFIQTLALPYTVGFDVFQRYALRELIYVGRELVRMALLLVLLLAVSANVLWIVVSTVIANLLAVALIAFLSRRMLPGLRFSFTHVHRKTSFELMSFGVWTTIGQLSSMIYRSGGVIVLNSLGTAIDVTVYHLGSTIDRQITTLSSMATAPILPSLTAMNSAGDTQRLGNAYLRGGRYGLWASSFVACPLLVFGREFIGLYVGEKFQDAAFVIALLVASYPFLFSEVILPKLAMARAQVKPYSIGAIVSSIATVALMVYTVGVLQLGAVGVALSCFLGCAISRLVFFWPLGCKLAHVSMRRFLGEVIIPGLLPAVVAMPCWLALKWYRPPSSWAELIAFSLAGQAVYLLVLFTACLQPVERAELAILFNWVRRRD